MTPFVFALVALAAYRCAIAVSADVIFGPFRAWVVRRWPHFVNDARQQEASWQAKLVHCGRCLGVWTSLPFCVFAGVTGLASSWAAVALAWPASAAVVAIAVKYVP